MIKPNNHTLDKLRDKELDSICFRRGYVELGFPSLSFQALADPICFTPDGSRFDSTHSGYRDVLCGLIGDAVTSTFEAEEKLEVRFRSGALIVVPLDCESPPGPEMATLSGGGRFYQAWLRKGSWF